MPSIAIKLYSALFKVRLKHKLQNSSSQSTTAAGDGYGGGIVSRPLTNTAPANASFENGIATKDINTDPFNSLSLRIFLPISALPQDHTKPSPKTTFSPYLVEEDNHNSTLTPPTTENSTQRKVHADGISLESFRHLSSRERRMRHGIERRTMSMRETGCIHETRRQYSISGDTLNRHYLDASDIFARQDWVKENSIEAIDIERANRFIANDPISGSRGIIGRRERKLNSGHYNGYLPPTSSSSSSLSSSSYASHKKLPIIVQFHGGGFVAGSKDSLANDLFCRRMAKLCDAIVIAVGYSLAPEHKYPKAFDDGFEALRWLANQANLAECNKSSSAHFMNGFSRHGSDREIADSLGGSVVEPWLAAHGDPSRCVLLGVSSGGNIANEVARKAVKAGKLLEPVKVRAQVLMYPFFFGSIPTHSEIKLANSYFYDKGSCVLAWKLLLPEGEEYDPDHPVLNPLTSSNKGRGDVPLKSMPPTLTVVAEHDWMKDRAITYSEALRKAKIDAPVLEYKDAVHEFATLDFLVNSRQAEACAEDMAIWMKKYLSLKGHELSY